MSRPTARLFGNRKTPRLELRFVSGQALPAGVRVPHSDRADLAPVKNPPTYLDWVRRLPGRAWDSTRKCWVAWDLGVDPDGVLAHAQFDIDLSVGIAAGFNSLADLTSIIMELCPEDPSTTFVYQRMTTREDLEPFLPTGARYDTKEFRWVVQTADLHDSQLGLPSSVRSALKSLAPPEPPQKSEIASTLAEAASFDDLDPEVYASLQAAHGPIPTWFGLELYPYQHVGVYSVLAGHNALCDSPGLGKTRQALAAIAVAGSQRTVIVVPPVVLTNWKREVMQANLAGDVPPKVLKKDRDKPVIDPLDGLTPDEIGRRRTHKVVLWSPSRKIPPLPERGIVIVPDSLLTARPHLRDELGAWSPDSFIVDEVHRTMNWDSARSKAVRDMARRCTGLKIVISGTPMFASPSDLCSSLEITGHLRTVFGGYSKFLETFTTKNRFDKYQARKRALPLLHDMLIDHVWTRRTKGQVLPFLPKKSRHALHLDVDLKAYKDAHREVQDIIGEWLDKFFKEFGEAPSEAVIEDYAMKNLYLVTLLRRAAGMTKISAAAEIIREHVIATTEEGADGHKIYTRPLIVWTHHKDVTRAMVAALPADVGTTAAIFGETSPEKRGQIVDDFQAGRTSVLVASISAASVGITLTRSCDAMFVETDWSPQQVTQAEDRCVLEGQKVMTRDGLVPIEDIEIGQDVLTHTGAWQQVTDKWSRTPNTVRGGRNVKRTITEVRYVGSQEPLKVTDDHEVLYVPAAGGEPTWATAGSLMPGDFLVTPRPRGVGVTELVMDDRHRLWSAEEIERSKTCACGEKVVARGMCDPHYRKHMQSSPGEFTRSPNGRYVSTPERVQVDDDFLKLCGWYVAEGFSSTRGGKGSFISLAGHQDERDILVGHGEYLKRTFGMSYAIYTKGSSKGIELRSYGYELASWFREMFGHGAINKRLPSWVFGLTVDQTRVFMDSYVDGDGHVKAGTGGGKVVSWATASSTLGAQMAVLAASQGIRASLHTRVKKETGVNGRELVAHIGEYSTMSTTEDDVVLRKVVEVNHRFMRSAERVWDLTVEHDESYVVGMVATHNCSRIGQERPVTLTTLIAEGTLDLQVQRAQQKKIGVLSKVLTGDDIFVSVVDEISVDGQSESMKIIKRLVAELIEHRVARKR